MKNKYNFNFLKFQELLASKWKYKKLNRKVKRQRDARVMEIRSYFIKVMIENNLNGMNLQIQMHKIIWDPEKKGV
jgi:hypothetical protein